MQKRTRQMDFWKGDFGKKYTKRNTFSVRGLDKLYVKYYGVTRTAMNREFLNRLDRNIRILEVGCNNGQQLRHLQAMGFKNLYGIELQWDAVEMSKSCTKNINIIQGSAFDLPFKDNYFDLVFTAGVLIHINPKDLPQALKEMHRCAKKFVWGFEYFSDKLKEINYRGHKGFLWKQDFAKLFLKKFKDLTPVKEKRFKYIGSINVDSMYLLKKKNA